MKKRRRAIGWAQLFHRQAAALTRMARASSLRALPQPLALAPPRRGASPTPGTWLAGVALGPAGARRFRLYRPPGVQRGEHLPLLVMLHGCAQDADSFAASTRMNRVALRERFLVLYPEQDRLANGQACWNWFETDQGRAYQEAASILAAIDQVCRLHPVDPERVALVGLSAGASMAALLATRHPERFKALVMHSGIAPGTAHSALSALRAMRGQRATTLPLTASAGAAPRPWPPLLVIHGNADGVVSPRNGHAAAEAWARAGGAVAGATRRVQRGQRHPMAVTDFRHRGRLVATLVAVGGLAHAWSGGASSQAFSDGQGPDASRMAWAFAARRFSA